MKTTLKKLSKARLHYKKYERRMMSRAARRSGKRSVRNNPSFWSIDGKALVRGAVIMLGATIIRELIMRSVVNPYLNKVLPVQTDYAPPARVSDVVAAVEKAVEMPAAPAVEAAKLGLY